MHKTARLFLKVADRGCYDLFDADSNLLASKYNCYVPDWVPGEFGDYVDLAIDLETGQILNWEPPTQEQLEAWVEGTK